eukprot:5608678-Lingulodinium_polyedra.AAC.1
MVLHLGQAAEGGGIQHSTWDSGLWHARGLQHHVLARGALTDGGWLCLACHERGAHHHELQCDPGQQALLHQC